MISNNLVRKALYAFMFLGMLFSTLGTADPHQAWTKALSAPRGQTQTTGKFRDLGLISQTDGWVLIGSHLYWTVNRGVSWSEMTPSLPSDATIYAVRFLNTETGWMLWADSGADGSLVLQMERTSDHGNSWNNTVVQTLVPNDPDIDVESASLDWLDENTGWVSVKQKTGSNFSLGTLFRTGDGGQTWVRSPLPIGEPVYFVNSQVGWMAGGPAGDQLFKTQDGGGTWEEQSLPGGIAGSQSYSIYPPVFDSPKNGLLTVVTLNGDDFQAGFYSTTDGGQNWILGSSLPLGSRVSRLPLSLLDARNLSATIPDSNRIIHLVNGEVKTVINQDKMSAAIVDLKMLSSNTGWAKWNTGDCTTQATTDGSKNISCTSTTKLIATQDGGLTWDTVALPVIGNKTPTLTQSYASAFSSLTQEQSISAGNTLSFLGQGFDQCEITNLDNLQNWWNNSPYKTLNLYIGGSLRGCTNHALNASYVNQMRQQGWAFSPTWVGPQAPCTSFSDRIDSNVTVAYNEGVNQADLAVTQLVALALSNSVVYYDMEGYGTDQACRNAVNAFVNGWVHELHTLGYVAGIYASTMCNTGLSDYINISYPPDVIWPARWYHNPGEGSYDPSASVWDLGSCVPTTAWNNHQRIRQYGGDNNETWGSVTLNIDENVMDGVVAVPFFGVPSANFSASPLSGTVPLTVVFNINNTAFITTCSWNYGDGQTGSSCASSHSHVYTTAGTYTVSLTVSGPGGSGSLTRSNYIIVTQPAGLPDLIPYPRSGESTPVVLSSLTGTTTNGNLYAGQPVYIDWGIKNNSTMNITTNFTVDLFINDQRFIDYVFTGLGAGATAGFDDWSVTWNTAGCYPVKLVVDNTDNVVESNENNNNYSSQFCWEAAMPVGPTTVAPAGMITATKPTFQWLPVTNAYYYMLYVYSIGANSNVYSIANIPYYQVCTATLCSYPSSIVLSAGDYQFKVGMINIYNDSAYSPWMTFTVGGAPATPSNLLPTGTVTVTKPTFTWNKSAGASWYDLFVYPAGLSIPITSATSLPASSICNTSTCTWTPSTDLPSGYYLFNVRAGNLVSASAFSPWGTFTVAVDNTTQIISGNAGVAGATLSYSDGTLQTATADSNGDYLFTVSYNWSGEVTPSKVSYKFTPENISYTDVTSNLLNQNYTAEFGTCTISGNAGGTDVTLSYLDGGSQTATADANGDYSFTVPYNWSGTVTPDKDGYLFVPDHLSYNDLTSDHSGQNYAAYILRYIFLPLVIR